MSAPAPQPGPSSAGAVYRPSDQELWVIAKPSEEKTVVMDKNTTAGSSLAKVWARTRIAELADRLAWSGDPGGELREAIPNTALRHQLVSNYTSFVAVDSLMRTAGDHGVTVHQAVPVPDGVRYDTTVE